MAIKIRRAKDLVEVSEIHSAAQDYTLALFRKVPIPIPGEGGKSTEDLYACVCGLIRTSWLAGYFGEKAPQ